MNSKLIFKKIPVLFFCLLIASSIYSQEQAIKITNQDKNRELVFKENKRIRIQTVDGRKISGRFKIAGDSIIIKNNLISMSNIETIKRNPLSVSLITSGALIYGGLITAGLGTLVGMFVSTSGYYLLVPAAGLIYTGIKAPNLSKKYKRDKNWTFETVTTPH